MELRDLLLCGMLTSHRYSTVTQSCWIFDFVVSEEEIRVAEEKFEESKELCYSGMMNLMDSEVSLANQAQHNTLFLSSSTNQHYLHGKEGDSTFSGWRNCFKFAQVHTYGPTPRGWVILHTHRLPVYCMCCPRRDFWVWDRVVDFALWSGKEHEYFY